MVCHTSKDTFRCQHCEKTFVFKNSLKKHLEKGRCSVLKQQKLQQQQQQQQQQNEQALQKTEQSNQGSGNEAKVVKNGLTIADLLKNGCLNISDLLNSSGNAVLPAEQTTTSGSSGNNAGQFLKLPVEQFFINPQHNSNLASN